MPKTQARLKAPDPLEHKKTPIHSWARDDRPREKMDDKGSHTLSNVELLTILIRTGTLNASALNIAKAIMDYCKNDPNLLGQLHLRDFMKFKGVGLAKAAQLTAALELGKRMRSSPYPARVSVTNSSDVVRLLRGIVKDHQQEACLIVFVNQRNVITHYEEIGKGTMTSCLIDVRIILRKALERRALGIILCHNHPSGAPEPSEADIQITHKLKKAAATMDIRVLDHLIICENACFSFAENGLMK
jgi:DNA repair protein RadC